MQAVGAAGLAEAGLVAAVVAARLVRQRLEHDVQREAAERLGLELAGVDDAAEQAGELRRVLREDPQLGRAELAEPDEVVAVVVQEARAVSAKAATSLKSACSFSSRSSSVPVVVTVLRRICADLGQHVGVDVGDPAVSRRSSTSRGSAG